MCGLGAILRTDGAPIPDAWLDLIDSRVAYRGPDGHARFHDTLPPTPTQPPANVALVHRRLAIIDLAHGHQPMLSPPGPQPNDDLLAVVCNGCIYNHQQLRAELAAHGHDFTTDHSDTEVLLHGHRRWGDALPDRLEGMYAYVLWDRKARRLILARDWFGEKPLYVARLTRESGAIVIAASDARAVADVVAAATGSFPETDARWRDGYLQLGYAPDGLTPYAGVRAVPTGLPDALRAGHTTHPPMTGTPEDAFAQRIEQAVASRLESDVPLGCFLSGGVDSSLVAHYAVRHRPNLATFSVQMPDPRYDESHHAELVASHLGTQHTTLTIAPRPVDDLRHLIETLGQPFGDSSILPTYWVSRAAREHVKVALSGDGADELFYGYERYLAARPLAAMRRALGHMPQSLGTRAHAKGVFNKLGRLGAMARNVPHMGAFGVTSIFSYDQLTQLLGHAPDHIVSAPFDDADADLRRADVLSYLPGDLLTKVDTAAMATDLEVRAPFLDRALARAALTTPARILRPRGQRKGLLRAIARRVLPASIVDRPKMGFAVPISTWFRDDHASLRTLLLDQLTAPDAFGSIELDPDAVRGLIDEHTAGHEHGVRLFTLLTLAMWATSR